VWRTADGVFVCHHDQSTNRMTGVDLDIPSSSWAELQDLMNQPDECIDTDQPARPMARLEQILDNFPNHIISIEMKGPGSASMAPFLDLLDTYDRKDRIIIQMFAGGQSQLTQAKARGYTTWANAFDEEITDHPEWFGSNVDLVGLNWDATDEQWEAAVSYGKPTIGHVIGSLAQALTAISQGANGLTISRWCPPAEHRPPGRPVGRAIDHTSKEDLSPWSIASTSRPGRWSRPPAGPSASPSGRHRPRSARPRCSPRRLSAPPSIKPPPASLRTAGSSSSATAARMSRPAAGPTWVATSPTATTRPARTTSCGSAPTGSPAPPSATTTPTTAPRSRTATAPSSRPPSAPSRAPSSSTAPATPASGSTPSKTATSPRARSGGPSPASRRTAR